MRTWRFVSVSETTLMVRTRAYCSANRCKRAATSAFSSSFSALHAGAAANKKAQQSTHTFHFVFSLPSIPFKRDTQR